MIVNDKYETIWVEAQKNMVVTDPFGQPFKIWQGMQFKFTMYTEQTVNGGCGSCTDKTIRTFFINAFAHCCEGDFIWEDGKTVAVTENDFIVTDQFKYPPVTVHIATELGGKLTELHTPPHLRAIPRKGGVWYDDPWETEKTDF